GTRPWRSTNSRWDPAEAAEKATSTSSSRRVCHQGTIRSETVVATGAAATAGGELSVVLKSNLAGRAAANNAGRRVNFAWRRHLIMKGSEHNRSAACLVGTMWLSFPACARRLGNSRDRFPT